MKQSPQKVVFFDRDGVINESPGPGRYVRTWREFRFRPGALPMLKALFSNGYRLVVVTNQQGVGKGLINLNELKHIHDELCAAVEHQRAQIDGVFYCPHLESAGCGCRKPKPGLIHRGIRALGGGVEVAQSWLVGDSPRDIQAGHAVGLRTLLVGSPSPQMPGSPPALPPPHPSPTYTVDAIDDVATTIFRHDRSNRNRS